MRFDPITTALIMWIFGFICGALAYWVRGLRVQQRFDNAVAELDAFVRPQADSIIPPGTMIQAHNKAFGRGRR